MGETPTGLQGNSVAEGRVAEAIGGNGGGDPGDNDLQARLDSLRRWFRLRLLRTIILNRRLFCLYEPKWPWERLSQCLCIYQCYYRGFNTRRMRNHGRAWCAFTFLIKLQKSGNWGKAEEWQVLDRILYVDIFRTCGSSKYLVPLLSVICYTGPGASSSPIPNQFESLGEDGQ